MFTILLLLVDEATTEKDEHIILDDILSKEPLAPASDGRDHLLADAMRWVIFSLISALTFVIIDLEINFFELFSESSKYFES